MYQWPKEIVRMNYEPFLFNPKEIDFMLLTHAHIDHCGLIPKLQKAWFNGKIYTTSATRDLVEILLEDSAEIQKRNIEDENRRRQRQHLSARTPLFIQEDVDATMPLFQAVEYNTLITINENIAVKYQDAGHILGSASLEVFVTEAGKQTKIVFSGDIGQRNVPIIKDPTLITQADYILIESTYGDRIHEDAGSKEDLLLKYATETFQKWGKLMIPTFAVERTQELLYFISRLVNTGKFPHEKIFLDSPLAIKATEVFKKHTDCYDDQALKEFAHPLDDEYLEYSLSVDDSMKLNAYADPCVIMAGNGMCTAGRITHHLRHGLSDPKNTLLFVWYQAQWTLGRYILEWEKKVRLMGLEIPVNCDIHKINSFSWHADANQLIRWAKGFTTLPKKIFIVHGEGKAQMTLEKKLQEIGFTTHIPSLGEVVEL